MQGHRAPGEGARLLGQGLGGACLGRERAWRGAPLRASASLASGLQTVRQSFGIRVQHVDLGQTAGPQKPLDTGVSSPCPFSADWELSEGSKEGAITSYFHSSAGLTWAHSGRSVRAC